MKRIFILMFLCFGLIGVSPIHALTLSEIKTQVRRLINDRPDPRIRYTDAEIVSYVNEAQREFVNQVWPLMTRTTITLVANTTYYNLPNDFINMEHVEFRDSTGRTRLLTQSTVKSKQQDNADWTRQTGQPMEYMLWNSTASSPTPSQIVFWPVATSSSVGTVTLDYYNQHADWSPFEDTALLDGDTDIPFDGVREYFPYHYGLVLSAAGKILMTKGDQNGLVYIKLAQEYATLMKDRLGTLPDYNPSFSQRIFHHRNGQMKCRLLILSFLFWPGIVRGEIYSINQFSGLNSDDSPLLLQNGQSPDSQNSVTDVGPGIQGRKGFVSFSSNTGSTGLWEFPLSNGTRFLIGKFGGYLKADQGTGAFTVTIGTVPTDRVTAATVLGDKFYYADTLNGLKSWDGTSVTLTSATMTVDKLVTWKGRLAAAGIAAAGRAIYLSKYLDGTSWTAPTNPSDDDAAIITVTGALDETIQALYASFQDKLMWFKANSFGGIYGSRRSNFSQRTFSDFVGVSSIETIRDCDGLLRWLGKNRVVYEFDGATFKKINEDVDTLFSGVSQGDTSSRSNTQTSQNDFAAGTQSPSSPTNFASTTEIIGSLTPKTSTFLDTAQGEFEQGTCVPAGFCETAVTPGVLTTKAFASTVTTSAEFGYGTFDNTVYVDTETTSGALRTIFPDDFTTLRSTINAGHIYNFYKTGGGTVTITSGSRLSFGATPSGQTGIATTFRHQDFTNGATFYFDLISAQSSAAGSHSLYLNIQSTAITSQPTIRGFGQYAFVQMVSPAASIIRINRITMQGDGAATDVFVNGGSEAQFTLPASMALFVSNSAIQFTVNGSSIIKRAAVSFTQTNPYSSFSIEGSTNTEEFTIDNFSVNPQTFTYTSSIFDTGISSPIWSTFISSVSGVSAITYTTQVATAPTGTFDSAVAATSGNQIGSANKRYLKTNAFFNHVTSGTVPSLLDYSVAAYSTGTFTSRAFDTGYAPPVWGVSQPSTSTNSSGVFTFFTQSSNDGSTWDSRVAAPTGSQIASATKRYLRYQADITGTNHYSTATLSSSQFTAKSTGAFNTQAVTIGNLISAWGPVTLSLTNDGGTFQIFFATSTNGVTFSSYTAIANGATPAVSTAAYAQVRVIFSITSATQTPRVDDITISWTEGSSIRAASAYYNQRYWLGVSISSSANNRVLVFDKKRQWQKYVEVNMDATTLYNSQLYFGNSRGIFQAESGYSDAGAAITAYYTTPTLAPTSLDLYSLYDFVYMTTDPSDSTLATTYQIDGVATDYSLGSFQMNSTTGLQNFKLPFPIDQLQTGKYISLKWQAAGTSFWRINQGSLYYQRSVLPE